MMGMMTVEVSVVSMPSWMVVYKIVELEMHDINFEKVE